MVMKNNFLPSDFLARISPLPLLATASPAANRERSSDDIHVVGRVRASGSSGMRAPQRILNADPHPPLRRRSVGLSLSERGKIDSLRFNAFTFPSDSLSPVPTSPCPRRGRRAPSRRAPGEVQRQTRQLMPVSQLVSSVYLSLTLSSDKERGLRRRGKIAAYVRCFSLALALAGCAQVAPAPAPRPVTVEVPVPTPIYCQVPTLNPPTLAIASLTPDSPPADTVRSYAATVDVLKSAVRERDSILAGCAPPLPTTQSAPSANTQPIIATPPAPSPSDNPQTAQVSIATGILTKMRKLLPW